MLLEDVAIGFTSENYYPAYSTTLVLPTPTSIWHVDDFEIRDTFRAVHRRSDAPVESHGGK